MGLPRLIEPHDIVAIKVHCGEWNNSSYLRPVYARALADKVRELGGRPFVCDTTTLPYGPSAGRERFGRRGFERKEEVDLSRVSGYHDGRER